ncbi:cupin domain-containing protein [Pelagibius sp.]|uniref:cupin domain-containing protein n=1 Tax=Pelagibius sp. TaxID=1931238 RepID=UPI00260B2FD8|nr:cupin domain-containing protein [Pelagibius sp.]
MAKPPKIRAGRFATPLDGDAVAADWRARGFSCHEFNDPPGQAWNDFVHDSDELVTVVRGRLELIVEAERFVVEAGDEAFIPRGARHSVRNLAPGPTRWLFGYG